MKQEEDYYMTIWGSLNWYDDIAKYNGWIIIRHKRLPYNGWPITLNPINKVAHVNNNPGDIAYTLRNINLYNREDN